MTVKELKTNNMGYTPYKMKGHTLKGIKQRGVPFSGGVGSNEMESGVADTINPSPNNFFGALGNIFKKKKSSGGAGADFGGMMEKVKAKQLEKQQGAFQAGGGSDLESRVSALEAGGGGGGGATPSSGTDPAMAALGMSGGGGLGALSAKPLAAEAMKKKKMAEGWGGPVGSAAGNTVNAVTAMSDIRLKEKIEKAGKSPSGIPIYVFSYIGDNRRYEGAMAQDLISMGIDAVETQESGYYSVDYSKIDVDMKLIN